MTLTLSQMTLSEADVEAHLKQLGIWASDFDTLMVRIAPRFKRAELRERVKEYVQGLLSSAERKNSWQIAEQLTGQVHTLRDSTSTRSSPVECRFGER